MAAVRHVLPAPHPSAISRDLRSPSSYSASSSPLLASAPASAPVVLGSNGDLAKICGSLVEPERKRQTWACHGCAYVFPRDATIYAAPASKTAPSASPLGDASSASINSRLGAPRGSEAPSSKEDAASQQEHYCKTCYTARYAMGACMACGQAVLGSTKEDGKYVRSGLEGHLWHGRCWACAGCGTSSNVNLGLDGMPTCDSCFDQPKPRKHVHSPLTDQQTHPSVQPNKPPHHPSRPLSGSAALAMSGGASRQKMGSTIAEMSRRFGTAAPSGSSRGAFTRESPGKLSKEASPVLTASSSEEDASQERFSRSPSRTGSIVGRTRPLTAQFSGQSFNLAAFKPSAPSLDRRDSRSRSASPIKDRQPLPLPQRSSASDTLCARCHKGLLQPPSASGVDDGREEVEMVSLQGGTERYHAECFCCGICNKRIDAAKKQTFIRLDDRRLAHPWCAPPATVERAAHLPDLDLSTSSSVGNCSTSSLDHVTHQREPRPSLRDEVTRHNLPQSYLTDSHRDRVAAPASADRAGKLDDRSLVPGASTASKQQPATSSSSASLSGRRFQPTSGAAPLTRSTLLQRPGDDAARHQQRAAASMAVGGRGPASASGAGLASLRGSHSSGMAQSGATRLGQLGGMQACGGCGASVSSLESVPGPRGQRWHRKCLVCTAPTAAQTRYHTSLAAGSRPSVCGKMLDSSAKVTEEGQLRCRACYDGGRARHPVRIA